MTTPAMRRCLLLAIAGTILAAALPAEEKKEQECKPTEELPIGTATQKYKFQYQSGQGQGCALYKVRNQAKGQYTPVHWKDDKETLLLLSIPRCDSEHEPCEWVQGTITIRKATKRETQLAYGVNSDEFTDKPRAFAKSKDDGDEKVALGASLVGTIADERQQPVTVNIKVSSSIKGKEGDYEITYTYRVGEKGVPLSVYKAGPTDPNIVWQSPKGKAFDAAFLKNIEQRKMYTLNFTEKMAEFSFSIGRVREVQVKEGLLEVYRGKTRIAAIQAPAYVSKD